jgi:hypothetical protein
VTGATSPLVDLDAFPDLGLIVKAATGVRYSTQAAGLACEHPEVEGYFVPLRTRVGRPELATFAGLLRGSWDRLSPAHADAVDDALSRHGLSPIRVDRSMLAESREAWVHVIVAPDEQELIPVAGLSEEVRGILIWPNSD